MKYWLIKSEAKTYSIDALKKDGATSWNGVRNYQARNFMRDDMKVGDLALFYHSNAEPSGVSGVCRVSKEAYLEAKPSWMMVDVEFVRKFKHFISLAEIKENPKLKSMLVIKRGMRLSIQPVDKVHFDEIVRMGSVS